MSEEELETIILAATQEIKKKKQPLVVNKRIKMDGSGQTGTILKKLSNSFYEIQLDGNPKEPFACIIRIHKNTFSMLAPEEPSPEVKILQWAKEQTIPSTKTMWDEIKITENCGILPGHTEEKFRTYQRTVKETNK